MVMVVMVAMVHAHNGDSDGLMVMGDSNSKSTRMNRP